MATTYYTPGVYIEEVDKGTKPIQGVSTSVTAFIGFTARAETVQEDGITTKSILGEPTLITNWGQYEKHFGSYDRNAYLPHAVRGFFDNGGTRCYVISVRAMEQHRAQVVVYGKDKRTEKMIPVLLLRAATGGMAGNKLQIRIDALDAEETSPPKNAKEETERALKKRFALVVNGVPAPAEPDTASGDAQAIADLKQQIGKLQAQLAQANQRVAEMQQEWKTKGIELDATSARWAQQVKDHPEAELEKVKREWEESRKQATEAQQQLGAAQQRLADLETKAAAKKRKTPVPGVFSFEFSLENLPHFGDEKGERQQWNTWRRSLGDPENPPPAPKPGSFIDQQDRKTPVEVWKLNKQGPEAAVLPQYNSAYQMQGGTFQFDYNFLLERGAINGIPEVLSDTEQTDIVAEKSSLLFQGAETARKGIDSLFAYDDINLVCAPDLMQAYNMAPGDADKIVKGVQEAILTFCRKAHYPFAILDAPPKHSVQQIADWRMALPGGDTMYGALYYPWIKITDPFDARRQIEIPPCGHLAGIYARSDSQRGVHKAPANEIVSGAVDLALNVTKNEQELLNPMGVNCIRAFPGRGIRVWGARTLAMTDPSWRYINVRRLFSYVEASVERSTQWVVFEPNDHMLWAKVRRDVSAFLRTVWLSGALFGLSPEEAFYVKCDEETNLPELRDLGQMVCEIGMSPVKPAEFVIFRFSQWTSDADTAS